VFEGMESEEVVAMSVFFEPLIVPVDEKVLLEQMGARCSAMHVSVIEELGGYLTGFSEIDPGVGGELDGGDVDERRIASEGVHTPHGLAQFVKGI